LALVTLTVKTTPLVHLTTSSAVDKKV